MPQMSPLSWLTLMFYFIILLIMSSILNYYLFSYKIKNMNNMKTNKTNWLW
uniref:ATP synthase F0 subunit 8 n=1 Tax=Scolytinae sp. BMNH 1274712 TaxID=1796543 RepID=A0A140EG42_9CUCU|nr:ATP synthase F0 subunit 8 [Scolytinae sp. BMNH 1274712]